MRTTLAAYWGELADTLGAMPMRDITRAAEILLDCQRRSATVFVAGNGGSAATASHFACDLAKGTRSEGVTPFRVVPLTDNVPLLTAWGNDTSYERVFAEQLSNLVRSGDVLVAISASGNSPNILAAAEVARLAGATVIAWTGETGGRVRKLADLTIRIPVEPIEQVEDAHMVLAHSLCVALRAEMRRERTDTSMPRTRLTRRARLARPVPEPLIAESALEA